MKTMNRLTIGRARDLIKRELGLSAAALTAPSDMNGNPSYPWYEMFPGNQHIEVTTDDIRQGKYTDKMIALSVTHMNSSNETSEYFYSDTLEYSEIYTEWKNRKFFCETMENPDDDPTLRRLKKEALDDSWNHYHRQPISQEKTVSQRNPSQAETTSKINDIHSDGILEKVAFDNFQGKLLQGHDLFMIRVFDLHGTYFSDTAPFDETQLDWWTKEVTQGVNHNPEKAAGWTVFQWQSDREIWWPYRPDGENELTYDTGRRSDGTVHEVCERELPQVNTQTGSQSPVPEPLADRLTAAHQELALQDKFTQEEDFEAGLDMEL